MERHFKNEYEHLFASLIKMGSYVEEAVEHSIKALLTNQINLAKQVIDGDNRINVLEIVNDNLIIDLLALHQPVATDLRMLLADTRINNHFERIGDHAVNLAESVIILLNSKNSKDNLLEIPKMAELTKKMLQGAINCFIHRDVQLAESVLKQDDEVDDLNKSMMTLVAQEIYIEMEEKVANPKSHDTDKNLERIKSGMELLRISRNFERISDLATNIAEEVIFIIQARTVKHNITVSEQK